MRQNIFPESRTVLSNDLLKKRAVASVIDYMLLLVLVLVLPVVLGEKTNAGYRVKGVLSLLPVFYWVVYFVAIEKFFSATPGKLLLGIKVERLDGGEITLSQACKRRVADFIEIIWCFGIVAYIKASSNPDNKRIGDTWANTRVVKKSNI